MDSQSPLANSLSVEENLLIRSGCRILESECKQHPFKFWGKVLGTQNDYYVVQLNILHPYRSSLTYYSRDARIWQTLPQVNPVLKKKLPRLNGMFTGDPTFTSNFVEYHYAGEAYYEPTTMSMKEEERLAYLIYSIDSEGILFPQGSVGLDEKGFVVRNPMYEGLSYDECHDFHNYLLYKPVNPVKHGQPLPDIGIEDPAHNILRPLTETFPTDSPSALGSWIFRDGHEEHCVILENVQWPGLYFWQNVDTSDYGRCYIGRGDKDIDVPFIVGASEDQDWVVDVTIVPDYDYKALPVEALNAAEEAFVADEERREKLLPPLPVKEEPTPPVVPEPLAEGSDEQALQEGENATEGETTDEEPPSTEATDVSEANDLEEPET